MHVVIIGAGLIGLTSAFMLRQAGVQVTVIERREGAGLETSFANGSLQHASMADPWNSPGVARDLLRWIGRDDAPMLLHLSQVPSLLGWGMRFLANSSRAHFHANTLKNTRLAVLTQSEMQALRAETGISYHAEKSGILTVSRSADAFAAACRHAETIAPLGVAHRVLDRDATVAHEPALAPVAAALTGSVFYLDDERADPTRFASEMVRVLQARGVSLRFSTSVEALRTERDRVRAVRTSKEEFEADAVVLAAASHSVALARPLGIRLPVRPVKGYSLTIPRRGSNLAPKIPVSDSGVHAAVVPVGDDRIRVAGTAEFAGFDTTVRPKRVENLVSILGKMFPDFLASVARDDIVPWAGLRPMSPDGVPIIGRTRVANLYLNTGHGHLGWTTCAGSARLLTDLILERAPVLPAADYANDRF